MKLAYRVGNIENTNEGLWYNTNGDFTGLIHSKYNFCKWANLEMPFREELVNKVSITLDIESLFEWIPYIDMIKLAEYGYRIEIYDRSKLNTYFNNEFNHYLIDKDYSKIVAIIDPREFSENKIKNIENILKL